MTGADPLQVLPDRGLSEEEIFMQRIARFHHDLDLRRTKGPDDWLHELMLPLLQGSKLQRACLALVRTVAWQDLRMLTILAHLALLWTGPRSEIAQLTQIFFIVSYSIELFVLVIGYPSAPWKSRSMWFHFIAGIVVAVYCYIPRWVESTWVESTMISLVTFILLCRLVLIARDELRMRLLRHGKKGPRVLRVLCQLPQQSPLYLIVPSTLGTLTLIVACTGFLELIGAVDEDDKQSELRVVSTFRETFVTLFFVFLGANRFNSITKTLLQSKPAVAALFLFMCFVLMGLCTSIVLAFTIDSLKKAAAASDKQEERLAEEKQSCMRELTLVLAAYDRDKDGRISAADLHEFYSEHSEKFHDLVKLTLEEAILLHKEIDVRETGEVLVDVFVGTLFNYQFAHGDYELLMKGLWTSSLRRQTKHIVEQKLELWPGGLHGAAEDLLEAVSCMSNQQHMDSCDLVSQINEVEAQLENVLGTLGLKDDIEEDNISDMKIQALSMRFLAQIHETADVVDSWCNVTYKDAGINPHEVGEESPQVSDAEEEQQLDDPPAPAPKAS